jgi:CMP-N-acetylneuraminic acid synthetase
MLMKFSILPRAIAVIPARGGSKRLPRKNVLEFGGKPMIAWTIEAAIGCGLFERVVVSTEDAEIADVARAHGAEVPFLRDQAFDDFAPVSEATCATLDQLAQREGARFDVVAQLMANCPLRGANDIIAAMNRFGQRQSPFLISCFRFGWMNPWWAVTLDAESRPTPIHSQKHEIRSQDLPTVYCPSGAIWIARVADLRDARTFYGPGHTFFPISWQSAVDIDDGQDLEMARAVLASRITNSSQSLCE